MCQSKDWDHIRQGSGLPAIGSHFDCFKLGEACWKAACSGPSLHQWGPGGLKRSRNRGTLKWSWLPEMPKPPGERKEWKEETMAGLRMRKTHR